MKGSKLSEKVAKLRIQVNQLITGTSPSVIFHIYANLSRL